MRWLRRRRARTSVRRWIIYDMGPRCSSGGSNVTDSLLSEPSIASSRGRWSFSMGNPAAGKEAVTRNVGGHEVTISNPGKVLFPKPKYTKLDLANYYLAVAEGALRGAGGRPNMQ